MKKKIKQIEKKYIYLKFVYWNKITQNRTTLD